jgi:hypothetical protein
MYSPASRRNFLQQVGAAAGGAVALGVTATPALQASQVPAAAAAMSKAARLRALLRRPGLLVSPEAYTVIAGKLAEVRGFEAIYIGGNMMSMTYLGVPAPIWGV